MNLYDKIEKLYQNEQKRYNNSINDGKWANEILHELKEIKQLLKENSKTTKKVDKNLMEFVNEFRAKMKPDIESGNYPEVNYMGKRLGVDNRGLLYNKDTLRLLSRAEAFEAYKYFFQKYNKNRGSLML